MKAWMKALMWFGLGGGIGFFAGFQVGSKGRVRSDLMYEQGKTDGYFDCALDTSTYEAEAGDAFNTYRGDTSEENLDEDGYPNESPSEDDDEEEDDDSALHEPPPPIDDLDEIPQLHPQDLTPEPIDEYNYYTNPWGFYKEHLYYYETDKVLYNQDTHEAIQNPNKIDQLLGVGMLFNFYKSDGEVLDAIFVKNDTLGMIFRIDRIDASYADEIVGADTPDYQEEDEDTE